MIEITGLNEMRERLRLLAQNLRRDYIVKAVKAAAQVIADAMQEQAPERAEGPSGDALPPGAMREDIKVRERVDKDGFATARIGPGKDTAHVARWVEYGHRQVAGGVNRVLASGKTRGAGHEIGQVPPHPFLRPAFERSEAKAIERFKEVLRDEIAGGLK